MVRNHTDGRKARYLDYKDFELKGFWSAGIVITAAGKAIEWIFAIRSN